MCCEFQSVTKLCGTYATLFLDAIMLLSRKDLKLHRIWCMEVSTVRFRSLIFHIEHNLECPRSTLVGLCSIWLRTPHTDASSTFCLMNLRMQSRLPLMFNEFKFCNSDRMPVATKCAWLVTIHWSFHRRTRMTVRSVRCGRRRAISARFNAMQPSVGV